MRTRVPIAFAGSKPAAFLQIYRMTSIATFGLGLAALSCRLSSPASVAFPARIGCGLAGGHWPQQLEAALWSLGYSNRHSATMCLLHKLGLMGWVLVTRLGT